MTTLPQAGAAPSSAELGGRIDATLQEFLGSAERELCASDPSASPLIEEIRRLLGAGGKRLRPAFCYWGFRATGRPDGEPIVRASAALELLHTMALVHDDVMDEASERRGVPSTHVHLEAVLAGVPDPTARRHAAISAAIIVGDLAVVLADRLFLEAGFEPAVTIDALSSYHRMRMATAAGQFLDVAMTVAGDPAAVRRAAVLKGGAYTVEGPLEIGAALAGANDRQRDALRRFGAPLSAAFQLRDDLVDGEGAHGATPGQVNALVREALDALDALEAPASAELDPGAAHALRALAHRLEMP
ncbi:MAG: polyprenyl synthetase family protein [Actinomycetota bacterium]